MYYIVGKEVLQMRLGDSIPKLTQVFYIWQTHFITPTTRPIIP